ncbi:hypothetical protein MW290_19015 [Aquincola tertiaricarbonis]|uniref:Transposase n=1 Tax=Aquincola tertiaricarbonis TaxID=391953 RepID=A0ABY4SCK6_AQUTE|nr:hypothetical protein [Aquincola tertiaricarbonis]URI11062.1 hypothetical protein MW290_19015 [Aquincola tertiaricarbonis]
MTAFDPKNTRMRWAVTQLRDKGRRLKRTEWPAPVVGELELSVMPETNAKRPLKKLELYGTPGTVRQSLLLPLFEPQIIAMDGAGLVLHGMQLASDDGSVYEHIQVWHCVPQSEL